MKKEWSSSWLSSVQPRKQRKYRYNAPLHVRRKFVSVNLSPVLRKSYNRRSMQVRKGDEIKVTRGSLKSKTGVVERVDLSKSKIYVDDIKVKKSDGSEVLRAMQPSNLMITKLKLDDKKRQAILARSEKPDKAGKAKPAAPETSKPVEKAAEKPAKSGKTPAKPARKTAKKPSGRKAKKK
jgi:large subunit ribosomal protein L24